MNFINIQYEKVDGENKGKVKYKVEDKELFAEETAMYYYKQNGYSAIWSENNYWWHIFGLLFWDIIFAKVTGSVVVSKGKFQEELYVGSEQFNELFNWTIQNNGIPADFFTLDFYKNRESLIKNRIKELANVDISFILQQYYKKNYGKNFRMIENWSRFTLEELLVVTKKITNDTLLKILERIMKNITENRSGFPDLIVYNDTEFFMAEVKSEKDKLSEGQKDWHSFLSSVGISVQLCFINHTDRQIANMMKKEENKKIVTITFGNSTSKKRDEAIEFIKKQSTFFTSGEGKNQIYGANFDVKDIENLYIMLDFTSGWKSQKIEIDGELIKSTELRNVLWCFREKNNKGAAADYCKENRYENGKNPFGCKMVYFDLEQWTEYGYVNTDSGEWIFNKDEIELYKNNTIEKLSYCPLFDVKKVEKVFSNIPDVINPVKNKEWAYISNNHDYWFYNNGKWISTWGYTNFPGIQSMVGVKKLDNKEKNDSIRTVKEDLEFERELSRPVKSYNPPPKKSGCFIATAVYHSYDSPEVQVLRKFRDKKLNRSLWGRIFIKFYYLVSPPISEWLKKNKRSSDFIKGILDRVIEKLSK